MREVFVRSPYNYDMAKESDLTGLVCPDDGVTQQQFKEECDINEIVRRFGLTGQLPDGIGMPQSGDFTGITDFQSAMEVVRRSQEAFMELPADIRARFANDPQRVLEFLADDSNRDEAIKLGIVSKPPEVPRDAVKAIDELAAKLVVPGGASSKS